MLRLNSRQSEALSLEVVRQFEDRLMGRLRCHFPVGCASLSDGDLQALIREGLQQTAAHSIDGERDVCIYVGLMVALGRDFAQRSELARAILADTSVSATDRVQRLYHAAPAISDAELVNLPGDDDGTQR